MTVKTQESGRAVILYDDALLDHADAALFTPPPSATPVAGGRGSAWVLPMAGGNAVLRHYRRGGRVAALLGDRYLWTGLAASRPWREWQLLHSLYIEGLPVPAPLAARVLRHGLFYCGDLLTRRIPATRSLAQALGEAELPWGSVGACIRRFHAVGVWHADLNAHNVLLDATGKVYLIDFDRGARRTGGAWQAGNLARLKRSLDKLTAGRLDVAAWRALLDGYRAAG